MPLRVIMSSKSLLLEAYISVRRQHADCTGREESSSYPARCLWTTMTAWHAVPTGTRWQHFYPKSDWQQSEWAHLLHGNHVQYCQLSHLWLVRSRILEESLVLRGHKLEGFLTVFQLLSLHPQMSVALSHTPQLKKFLLWQSKRPLQTVTTD